MKMAKRRISGAAPAARHRLMQPAAAAPAPITMSETEAHAPALPPILAARERAETENRIPAGRLDTTIPAIMRAEGIDLWLLVAARVLRGTGRRHDARCGKHARAAAHDPDLP